MDVTGEKVVHPPPAGSGGGAPVFLLRYDTECPHPEEMEGFLEAVVAVHRADHIPATFFCTGRALEVREDTFREFASEVAGDPLFDLQDHSHSHVGLGYSRGPDLSALREDYTRSFAVHERILGTRPTAIGLCGTGGKDGPRLGGFDATAKSRAELDLVADLGVRMIDAFLRGVDRSSSFCSYAALGHPDLMGFPSGYSDTEWLWKKAHGDPETFVRGRIDAHAEAGQPMPLLLHDWAAWNHGPDRNLGHVRRLVEYARKRGFKPRTHAACYDQTHLWREVSSVDRS